jgi:hypothetical protein
MSHTLHLSLTYRNHVTHVTFLVASLKRAVAQYFPSLKPSLYQRIIYDKLLINVLYILLSYTEKSANLKKKLETSTDIMLTLII